MNEINLVLDFKLTAKSKKLCHNTKRGTTGFHKLRQSPIMRTFAGRWRNVLILLSIFVQMRNSRLLTISNKSSKMRLPWASRIRSQGPWVIELCNACSRNTQMIGSRSQRSTRTCSLEFGRIQRIPIKKRSRECHPTWNTVNTFMMSVRLFNANRSFSKTQSRKFKTLRISPLHWPEWNHKSKMLSLTLNCSKEMILTTFYVKSNWTNLLLRTRMWPIIWRKTAKLNFGNLRSSIWEGTLKLEKLLTKVRMRLVLVSKSRKEERSGDGFGDPINIYSKFIFKSLLKKYLKIMPKSPIQEIMC